MLNKILLSLCLSCSVTIAMDEDKIDNILSPNKKLNNVELIYDEELTIGSSSTSGMLTLTKEDYDRTYIENILLPSIYKVVSISIYENYENFMSNRNKTGFSLDMTLGDYRNLVLLYHGNALSKLGVSIDEYNPPKPVAQTKEDYDRTYIENILLPAIYKVVPNSIYENYENFMSNRDRIGFSVNMTLGDFRNLVLQYHGNKLRMLGLSIDEYNPPKLVAQTKEDYDRTYIENILLPAIYKVVPNSIYENYENFMSNRDRIGFSVNMTLGDFRNLVLQYHGNKLRMLGLSIDEYNPPMQSITTTSMGKTLLPPLPKMEKRFVPSLRLRELKKELAKQKEKLLRDEAQYEDKLAEKQKLGYLFLENFKKDFKKSKKAYKELEQEVKEQEEQEKLEFELGKKQLVKEVVGKDKAVVSKKHLEYTPMEFSPSENLQKAQLEATNAKNEVDRLKQEITDQESIINNKAITRYITKRTAQLKKEQLEKDLLKAEQDYNIKSASANNVETLERQEFERQEESRETEFKRLKLEDEKKEELNKRHSRILSGQYGKNLSQDEAIQQYLERKEKNQASSSNAVKVEDEQVVEKKDKTITTTTPIFSLGSLIDTLGKFNLPEEESSDDEDDKDDWE